MQLRNSFPTWVRQIFMDCWACAKCGRNGQGRGGLEIHHIWGRISDRALNGAVLCNECHGHVGHSREERRGFFSWTIYWLTKQEYKISSDDRVFLDKVKEDIEGIDLSTLESCT